MNDHIGKLLDIDEAARKLGNHLFSPGLLYENLPKAVNDAKAYLNMTYRVTIGIKQATR